MLTYYDRAMKILMPLILFPIILFFGIFLIEEVVRKFPDSSFYRWWRKYVIADWNDPFD